jgi:hypothetical protein
MNLPSQFLTPILIILFVWFGTMKSSPGLIISIILSVLVRGLSFRNMFMNRMFSIWDIVNSVSSHILLFSSLYILLESEYTSFEPSGDLIDSIYYSVDTITTNGGARVIPVSGRSKLIHVVNLLDTYLLFVTIGFYIVQFVKSHQATLSLSYEIPGTM